MTTDEYLYDTEETNRIRELAMGMVREPPAPFFSHQTIVLKVARLWGDHVEPRKLGRVAQVLGAHAETAVLRTPSSSMIFAVSV